MSSVFPRTVTSEALPTRRFVVHETDSLDPEVADALEGAGDPVSGVPVPPSNHTYQLRNTQARPSLLL